MYLFNRITVNPQLPKRIEKLSEIANNLWWSWNTEFLRLFQRIDGDLWEESNKNPVKFLKHVSQERLEAVTKDIGFLKEYDKVVLNFDGYMNSKNTWFSKKYPEEKNDLIAYFSAEYGIDETIPIYSGGLGILSGDHLKSASDLGIPLVAVGLLYKNGYFNQKINGNGDQETEYNNIDLYDLPINPVKDDKGEDLTIYVKFPKRRLYLKVWQINVGRVKLYLLDSDIDKNNEEDRDVTLRLYGGDQEMRIRQEIVLGMAGVNLLKNYLHLEPTVYHMNEGHSAFLNLEIIKNIIYISTYTKFKSDGIYLIIAVKNQEEKIEGFLRSVIFKILYGKDEYLKNIIVADLKSTDKTKEIVKKLAEEYQTIKPLSWKECKDIMDNIDDT